MLKEFSFLVGVFVFFDEYGEVFCGLILCGVVNILVVDIILGNSCIVICFGLFFQLVIILFGMMFEFVVGFDLVVVVIEIVKFFVDELVEVVYG